MSEKPMKSKMNEKQVAGAVLILKEAIKALESGKVDWFTVAYKYGSGTTIKVRSEHAPRSFRMPE